MPADRSSITVLTLSGVLVLVSVAMIAIGLPEQNLVQHRLLQRDSVPLSGALALGVAHLATKLPKVARATLVVLAAAAAASAVGVGLMAFGLILGIEALLPLAQALMWLTLGFALLWVVARLPRKQGDSRTFGLRPIDEDDDG